MRSSIRRPFALTCVAVGLLCVLAGCIKIDYALEVNPDDTLSGDLLFAMDREVLTMDGKSEREVLEDFQKDADQQNAELPGVTEVRPYRKGGYLGQRVFFENVPFDTFIKSQKGMGFQLEHTDDQYRFDAKVEPGKSSDSDLKELDKAVTASMRLEVSITFPGNVIDTNGKVVDDRTVVWRLRAGKQNELHAVASDQPPGLLGMPAGDTETGTDAAGRPNWLWFGLAGVLAAAVAGGLIGGLRERRRT